MSDARTSDADTTRSNPIEANELALLQRRSDARGTLRLLLHLAAIGASGTAYAVVLSRQAPLWLAAASAVAYGFTLVTMFAAMHECVHRTAFKSQALNDGVAWLAGLLSFYNSTFYRPYHGWHHRYTQIPGKDPELEDEKPRSLSGYALELSGLPWWLGKLKTHFKIALGRTASYRFLTEQSSRRVVRSVRLQLLVYASAIAASVLAGEPYFATFWLIPVALAQPLLRAILLAEHTGCSNDDDPLANTRTTYTAWPVRLLMWEMPYHAEHHHYPALPFFSLARAHARLGPRLGHVARGGYSGFHADLVRSLARRPAREEAA